MSRKPIVLSLAGLGAILLVLELSASAGAAPTDADLQIQIGAITKIVPGTSVLQTPNGGTAKVSSLTFRAGGLITSKSTQPASATVRFELSDGLRWANGPPNSDNCVGTSTTAECRSAPLTQLPPGQVFGAGLDHWGWEIVASRPGRYTWKARITAATTPDPVLSNNASTITVIVTEAILAGAAKVSPAKPKAGSLVSASVEIFTLGAPVRPTALRCTGSLGSASIAGTPRAAKGKATCLYHPPRSAKGKTLRGAVAFTVSKTSFTKRFARRLS